MIKTLELENNELTLRGIMHQPVSDGKIPIVVMYHGFTGYKQELHGMFSKASRILAKRGIASVRFDFAGSGESDGEFTDMTFSTELSDGIKIFDFAENLDFVDKDNIYILGMSMGGAIASVVASQRSDKVKKLCLWAPAGELNFALRNYAVLLKGEVIFDARGFIDLNANVASKKLYDELETIDIYTMAKNYKGETLILHGSDDEVVPLGSSEKYLDLYGERAKLSIVKNANHTFDSEAWENEIIFESVEFLKPLKSNIKCALNELGKRKK